MNELVGQIRHEKLHRGISCHYNSHPNSYTNKRSKCKIDLLQQLLQFRCHGITNFLGRRLAAKVARTDTRLDHIAHGGLDGLGLSHAAERVLHHHGDGEDGCDGVHDAFSGDVGGGSCMFINFMYLYIYGGTGKERSYGGGIP